MGYSAAGLCSSADALKSVQTGGYGALCINKLPPLNTQRGTVQTPKTGGTSYMSQLKMKRDVAAKVNIYHTYITRNLLRAFPHDDSYFK